MDIEIELNGRLYQRTGTEWYDSQTYLRPPQAIIRALEKQLRERRARPQRATRTSPPHPASLSPPT